MNHQRKVFDISIYAWIVLLAIVFLVRAPFLFYFGFSVDAYSNAGSFPSYDFLASQGRPGSYLLFELLRGLGLYGPVPQYAAVLVALPLLCVSAVLLWSTLFKMHDSHVPAITMGAALFLAHPYNAEILTFRDAAPVYALSTCLGIGGYYLGVIRGRFVASTLLIALALSIYQTFVNFLAIVWLLTLMVACIDPVRLKGAVRDDLRKIEIRGVFIVLASLVTYLIVLKLLNLVMNTHQDGRATLIAFDEIPKRYRDALLVVREFFAGDLIAKASIASAATVLLWISGFCLCFVDGSRRIKFIMAPLVFVLACVASIGVILVGRDFWPMPRVLVGFALLPAFGGLCFLLYLRERGKRIMYGALGVLLLSYTGISATVAADQVRVNRRDMVIAAALDARMSLVPGQHVAIVRGPDAWHGLSTQRGDMNMSAYWSRWSKAATLSEFYGYPIRDANDAEYVRAAAYCKDAPIWPAKESTTVLSGDLAVVCMSRPSE